VAIVPETTWEIEAEVRSHRWGATGLKGATLWFTGLSGAGKSTIASAVEERLLAQGRAAYRLDGDKLRTGINADLGFDRAAREENVRRVAEVSRLLADAGLVVLSALISPYAAGREFARAIHREARLPFAEIFVATPIEVCEARDVKGLYARARAGEMRGMTGVDDPYEPPVDPELVVEGHGDLETTVDRVLALLAGWAASA
jgi:bifunctional enzyme CysN/CysC